MNRQVTVPIAAAAAAALSMSRDPILMLDRSKVHKFYFFTIPLSSSSSSFTENVTKRRQRIDRVIAYRLSEMGYSIFFKSFRRCLNVCKLENGSPTIVARLMSIYFDFCSF